MHGDRELTWSEYDEQAARVAAGLADLGLGVDGKVALYLRNRPEYLVAQFAAFKLRAVPVNANHRYVEDELAHLLQYTDAELVVCEASAAERVLRVRGRVPALRAVIAVDDGPPPPDGTVPWVDLLTQDPAPRLARRYDDVYLLCTGGTTGRPKGVLFPHGERAERFARAGLQPLGIDVPAVVEDVPTALRRVGEADGHVATVVCCPLMHGTGMWLGAFAAGALGGTTVTLTGPSFDPDEVWRTVARRRATDLVIVGDAVARPLLRALDDACAAGAPHDVSSLRRVLSSGAMWSAEVQEGFLAHADVTLVDRLGSTEGALVGVRAATRASGPATATFQITPGTKLFTEDGREVAPGSGERGVLATPATAVGYYKDTERSAATFREIDGVRYVFSGDWATVDASGTITFVGRGSQTVNTGGEKVFTEEVEEAVKRHPAIEDCLVVGVPHERLGEQVVAVVSRVPGGEVDEAELVTSLRSLLAGYKLPRRVVFVSKVERLANAKPDYRWAKALVLA